MHKFLFVFGLTWTLPMTIVCIIVLFVPPQVRGGSEVDLFTIIFLSVFETVGLTMMITGLKAMIRDKKIKKYGMQCYGIIEYIKETEDYADDEPEYKKILRFLNPETYQIETIEDGGDFVHSEHPINSYVLCKYYQGDINFERFIQENELPLDARNYLVPTQQSSIYSNLEYSYDEENLPNDKV